MTAEEPKVRIPFPNVDQAPDPNVLVRSLESRGQQPGWIALVEQQIERLGLKPGDRVLDVGSGIGTEAQRFAATVGPTGQVIGLDKSATMITAATERTARLDLPVEYRLGDVHDLPFPENSFDCSHAMNLLCHLEQPALALREMIRATRPGGRVLIGEPDFATWIVDLPDQALTRRLFEIVHGSFVNPWAGRQLYRLFLEAGLAEVQVAPWPWVVHDDAAATPGFFRIPIELAERAGLLREKESAALLHEISSAIDRGVYFASLTMFTVTGTV